MSQLIAYTSLFSAFALSVAGAAFGASINSHTLMVVYSLPGLAMMGLTCLIYR